MGHSCPIVNGMNDTAKWLAEYFGATSVREAAKAIGMSDHKKLGRWLDTEYAPWVVIALSRWYKKDPVERLYATGILTAGEAIDSEVAWALKSATDAQLSEEIVRRVRDGGFHATLTNPIEVPDDLDVVIGGEGDRVNPPEPEDDPQPPHRTGPGARGR